MKLGVLPLARPTFDLDYAGQNLAAMLARLDATGHDIVGPRTFLLDDDMARHAIRDLAVSGVEHILILQGTFTDAGMASAAAVSFDQPLSIWAVPEPRLGGRLRLNSFCGLNLASHAFGRNGRRFSWLYVDPNGDVAEDIADLLAGEREPRVLDASTVPAPNPEGSRVAKAVQGRRIARIGEHPAGFDTCAYDPVEMKGLTGVEVDERVLDDLFDVARTVPDRVTDVLRAETCKQLTGLDQVDQAGLANSLRLKIGLEVLKSERGYDAFAIRCWPEMFTEFGGAVCGPAAMLGEDGVPCACESDVYGALTQLVLQETAQAPVFLTDLVDIDVKDDTGVVWHCGQAPLSMRDPEIRAEATIHSNRLQPLLYEFPLKPGPVTWMRISQAFNRPRIVLGFGEMLRRPLPFSGTSGVIRFSRDADDVLSDIISSGLEHHIAIAYGDHRPTLRGVAGALELPLLEV